MMKKPSMRYCKWDHNFLSNLLRGLNACKHNNCPLQPGAVTINQEIDLSKFAPIISVSDDFRLDLTERRLSIGSF